MTDIHNRKYLEKFRKENRKKSTSAEATLWHHLKAKQLGWKFRRQHSVGNYILDFYCATERIAVELDGEYHFTEEGRQRDEVRTRYLNGLNIRVLRFENKSAFEDLDGVLGEIRRAFSPP